MSSANTSTEKKIQPEPFFDFLKESTPTKKSGKYVSKREELIRNHHKHYKVGKKIKSDQTEKEKLIHKEKQQKVEERKEIDKTRSKNEKNLSKDNGVLSK